MSHYPQKPNDGAPLNSPPQQYGGTSYVTYGEPAGMSPDHDGGHSPHDYYEPQVAYDEQTFGTSGLKPEEVEQAVPLYDDSNHESARRFVRTGYRDTWALALFALTICVSIGFAVHNAKDLNSENVNLGENGRDTLRHLRTWVPVAFGISVIVGMFATAAIRAFPKEFIIGANIMMIVLNLALAVFAYTQHQLVVAIIWLIIALLNAVWLYLVRHRIPFAALLLRTSVGIVTRFWGTQLVSFLCLCGGVVYFGVWTLMGAPITTRFANSDASDYAVPAAFGLLVALLWVTQVCANISHVTSSGVVATWYFFGPAAMPPSATVASAKRATTTSFGSICFGSLVVAIVKAIYYVTRMIANQNQNSFAACIAACIVGIIERLLEYFNVYAFTHVAIYGSSYVEAAKQTWALVKECGWAAYFNDCLVWPVLTLVAFFPAVAIGVAIGIGTHSVVTGIVVFFVCYVVLILLLRPIYSGVVTQFVCVAECPDVMQVTNPEYFAELEDATSHLNRASC